VKMPPAAGAIGPRPPLNLPAITIYRWCDKPTGGHNLTFGTYDG
jgi:hypothetical protein